MHALMLRRDFVPCELLHRFFCAVWRSSLASLQEKIEEGREKNSHIAQSNHADRLPNPQPNPRGHTTIQSLEPVIRIDVFQRLSHRQIQRPVRIHGFALHLDPNNLNRLIPRTQATTKTAGKDFLRGAEFLPFFFARDSSDAGFSQAGKTEA